jgi:predicted O-methyltransferase YrrM
MSYDDLRELLVQIDLYVEELFAPPDAALEAALRRSREAGLPEIYVSRNEGKLLQLLAEIAGARCILEIGTLGGYSTIHLARALPQGGSLVSLELDERYAGVARENVREAGLETGSRCGLGTRRRRSPGWSRRVRGRSISCS